MRLSFSNVRSVLEHCGPMTMHEVARFFPGADYRNVSSILSAMRIKVAMPQVYIQSWTKDGVGRRYLRAVYAIGYKPDAAKPDRISNAQRMRDKRSKKRIPKVPKSVFELGAFL